MMLYQCYCGILVQQYQSWIQLAYCSDCSDLYWLMPIHLPVKSLAQMLRETDCGAIHQLLAAAVPSCVKAMVCM